MEHHLQQFNDRGKSNIEWCHRGDCEGAARGLRVVKMDGGYGEKGGCKEGARRMAVENRLRHGSRVEEVGGYDH